jgi:hypothetical protein
MNLRYETGVVIFSQIQTTLSLINGRIPQTDYTVYASRRE